VDYYVISDLGVEGLQFFLQRLVLA
jgi:hypothetical protein